MFFVHLKCCESKPVSLNMFMYIDIDTFVKLLSVFISVSIKVLHVDFNFYQRFNHGID